MDFSMTVSTKKLYFFPGYFAVSYICKSFPSLTVVFSIKIYMMKI